MSIVFKASAAAAPLALGAALLFAPAALSAQGGDLPAVDPAVAIAAAGSCREAPLGFVEAQAFLRAHNWSPTTFGLTRQQAAMVLPFPVYERDHVALILLPLDHGAQGSCGITSHMRRGAVWTDIVAATAAAFGRAPDSVAANQANWTFEDRMARATLDGDTFIIRFHPAAGAASPTAAEPKQ